MQKVLTAEQMRDVDRLTTEKYGIPSIILMENAAHAVARVITEKIGGSVKGKSILILCGKGNNGGDGAALGRILGMVGARIALLLFGRVNDTKGDANTNFQAFIGDERVENGKLTSQFGDIFEINSFGDWETYFQNQNWDVVVDALFGTGLMRPIDGWMSRVLIDVNDLNHTQISYFDNKRLRVSVDLPSGLDADRAAAIGETFRSDVTVTFTSPKPANVLAPASGFSQELLIADIGSPSKLIDEQDTDLYLSEEHDVLLWLDGTRFLDDSYKNKRGHALIIAGSAHYSGAAVLCGNAAMRSGVGLVTIATPKSAKESVASRVLPEVMVRSVAETENGAISDEAFGEIGDLLEKADSVAIGSGLSQDESTKKFVESVLRNRRQATIVDADALNLLSPFLGFAMNGENQQPLVLTPHEGEFLRLLGTDDKDAIKDRVAAVREFATQNNVILVLKGERVLIGEPGGRVVVNPTGNSGLGKAGNGDTLTGILAGFVAQAVQVEIEIFETVIAAVYVAGMAGDIAEKKFGKRVMTASDVRECLSDVFASFREGL